MNLVVMGLICILVAAVLTLMGGITDARSNASAGGTATTVSTAMACAGLACWTLYLFDTPRVGKALLPFIDFITLDWICLIVTILVGLSLLGRLMSWSATKR